MYVNKKLLNFFIALLFSACKSASPKTLTTSNIIFSTKSMTWNIANKLPAICIDYKVTPDLEPTQL